MISSCLQTNWILFSPSHSKEMSVLPSISLKPEVTDFLQHVFVNKEVVGFYAFFFFEKRVCLFSAKPHLHIMERKAFSSFSFGH